jgi:hypothetical protein
MICNSDFWTSFIVYISIELQRFGSWIFFRLQVKKEGQKPLLGPLVELASDLTEGAQQLGFLSFLFYLNTEEDPASETL